MTVGLSLARLLVIVAGIAIALLGLYLIALPGGPGTIVGIYTVLGGLALIVGAVIERVRYRSEAGDRDGAPPGAPAASRPGPRSSRDSGGRTRCSPTRHRVK